ncbi:MAG: branched-chain amino acid ABC transporter permease [Candidatus Dormibacteria bacterium]
MIGSLRRKIPVPDNILKVFALLAGAIILWRLPFDGPNLPDPFGTLLNPDLVTNMLIFVLLALGLNIVVGFAGLLDLGYAAFFAIGAYGYAELASSHYNIHVTFVVLLIVAAFLAAGFGVILGAPTLRLRGDYLAIVTLGFGEIVPRVFRNAESITGGVNGLSALDQPSIGPIHFGQIDATPYYFTILVVLALSVLLIRNLQSSRLGRAWQAIREDELAAQSMGINTVTTKLLAFAMGAAFSGFAGCFYASKLSLVSPESFQFAVSVTILSMVVLGGMGNILGVIVGACLIFLLEKYFLIQLPQWMQAIGGNTPLATIDYSRYTYIILGVLLITFMLLRPQGLIPSRLRRAELKEGGELGGMGATPETVAPGGPEVL